MREGHSGGLEVVGKHEMLENYLWVVSVGIGDDRKWGRGGAVLPCSGGTLGRAGYGGHHTSNFADNTCSMLVSIILALT